MGEIPLVEARWEKARIGHWLIPLAVFETRKYLFSFFFNFHFIKWDVFIQLYDFGVSESASWQWLLWTATPLPGYISTILAMFDAHLKCHLFFLIYLAILVKFKAFLSSRRRTRNWYQQFWKATPSKRSRQPVMAWHSVQEGSKLFTLRKATIKKPTNLFLEWMLRRG